MQEKKKIDLDAELKKCKTMEDLTGKNGLVQRLIGKMVEKLLAEEMEEHLGYKKHEKKGYLSGNSRNGANSKQVKSSFGEIDIAVPRDRNGTFEPRIIKKRQTNISSFDQKIISMYAKGMTTRDIQDHVLEIYGADISPTMISHITEKVLSIANEWQSRPLESLYLAAFFDAIHYKVREDGKVVTKAAYTCLGITNEGKKEVLGVWIGESEGAKFWLSVFSELKNRGVKDIFVACVDGLKGLPDAIKQVFPKTEIQLCVIHLIRHSMRYIPHKNIKEFMLDLKNVYRAPSLKTAENNLSKLQTKWIKRYPFAINPWIKNWENIKTFFQFPEPIRRLIYTTNTVESLHRQFRKVSKTRSAFPNDEALFKLLFLAIRDISKKWTQPIHGWREAVSHFAILYGERLNVN